MSEASLSCYITFFTQGIYFLYATVPLPRVEDVFLMHDVSSYKKIHLWLYYIFFNSGEWHIKSRYQEWNMLYDHENERSEFELSYNIFHSRDLLLLNHFGFRGRVIFYARNGRITYCGPLWTLWISTSGFLIFYYTLGSVIYI